MRSSIRKWVLTPVALAAALTLAAGDGLAQKARHPRELTFPALGEVTIPETGRHELDNGMILYLLEDHEFPVIEVRALIRGGSAFDPQEKIGLAQFTAEVVRSGGSERYPGDELDEKIERLGMSMNVSAETSRFNASLSMLTENLDEGLDIFSDLLRNPVFPEDKLDESRTREKTSVASRNDETLDIAIRELRKRVYGADSPYGWHTEYATIGAIQPADLKQMHQRFFHPNHTILVAWGDFDAKKMKKKIVAVFGSWKRTAETPPSPPAVPDPGQTALCYAPKTDVTQSMILIGGITYDRRSPLFPAGELLQEALGGGFSSRLVNEIRTKRGLAYMTGAFINPQYDRRGTAGAYAATQSESTVVTLNLMIDELNRVISERLSEEEIERARDAILNRFVFDFDSPGEVAYRQATYEFYGYPPDFLDRYQEGIRAATLDDVLAAAQATFRPADWQIIVVGNKDDFAQPLGSVMPVIDLDISIPEPQVTLTIPDATPKSLEAGQKLLAEAVRAAGGAEAIAGIRNVTAEGSGTASIQGMSLQINFKHVKLHPDHVYFEQNVMGQLVKQAITGETGWRQTPMGIEDLSKDEIAEAKRERLTDDLHLLQNGKQLEIQALGQEEIDGTRYDVAYVRDAGDMNLRIYFDPSSHQITRMAYKSKNPMTGAPAEKTSVQSDYREVAGVQYSHKFEEYMDGELFFSGTLNSVTINGEIDPAIFDRPQ